MASDGVTYAIAVCAWLAGTLLFMALCFIFPCVSNCCCPTRVRTESRSVHRKGNLTEV